MKTGIELEYWVVDDSGRLTSAKPISQVVDNSEQEFVEPMLEIKTKPHEEVEGVRQEAFSRLQEAIKEAEKRGLNIAPVGTTLSGETPKMLESDRGKLQEKIVGENIEYAKNVAGTHFHFEQEDTLRQLNTLTALDPSFSVMNSSPYFRGENLGRSSRNIIYRHRCYEEMPTHGQLWSYADSVEEWQERINSAFKEFKRIAAENEISEQQIEENFKPENALWTPVRLRNSFSSVEWRSPDTGLLTDALHLLKEVKQVLHKEPELPKFAEVERNTRKAMETGEVADYLKKFGINSSNYEPLGEKLYSGQKISEKDAMKKRLKAAELLKQDAGL